MNIHKLPDLASLDTFVLRSKIPLKHKKNCSYKKWFSGRPFTDSDGELVVGGRPVCDDGWDINDANVACKMMGYQSANTAPTQISLPYPSPADFVLDNVDCTGEEDDLFQCPYVAIHNCGNSEGAGVTCSEILWGGYQTGCPFLKAYK